MKSAARLVLTLAVAGCVVFGTRAMTQPGGLVVLDPSVSAGQARQDMLAAQREGRPLASGPRNWSTGRVPFPGRRTPPPGKRLPSPLVSRKPMRRSRFRTRSYASSPPSAPSCGGSWRRSRNLWRG
ncbi:hypothetical protein ACFSHP_03780 [Novosphingobium panipatense]